MAVTKIWNIKDRITRVVNDAMNPEKTTDDTVLQHDLSQVLDYAEKADKTDHFCYVTGVNCISETAVQQMTMTTQRYGKIGGNVAFYAYQSFNFSMRFLGTPSYTIRQAFPPEERNGGQAK